MEENYTKGFSIKNIYNILNKRTDSIDSQISVIELQETSPGIWETNILIPLNNNTTNSNNSTNSNNYNGIENLGNLKSIYKNGIKNLDQNIYTTGSTGSIKSINNNFNKKVNLVNKVNSDNSTKLHNDSVNLDNPNTNSFVSLNNSNRNSFVSLNNSNTNSFASMKKKENLDKNIYDGVFIPIFGPYGCNFPPDYRLVQSRYGPSYQCSYPQHKENFPLYINNQFLKPKKLARWNSIDKDNLYHWDPFNLNQTFPNPINFNPNGNFNSNGNSSLNRNFNSNGNFKRKNSQKREILIYPQ
ncbi:uncharacterized protein TA18455 [Theileria annulata]|uniref:Uncharacterized protein n=1 Tax=Theileria annulata TaxID=5874 RepID=Q4UAW4_THEAN|nr:uncharacterized protein TA18455 [Theileria annulata]CAI76037.1 hypothetical protein TA18455 [Theileria annulata]|eukprot:XP_955513.1 hypothetical protein TA18455 [Theileria annulata]